MTTKSSQKYNPRNLLIYFVAVLALTCSHVFADSPHFPVPDIIRPNVNFWIRIYTEVGLQEGLLHDRDYPQVVYEKVVSGNRTGRARSDNIDARRQIYVNAINTIRDSSREQWGAVENRVAEMFRGLPPNAMDSAEFRIRHQTGQRERFRAGVERSGAYIDTISAILRKYDVPDELKYLPHVESSFDYEAYSKVGAAGLWQFMRATARAHNMRVDYLIDERRDPIIATDAAARFLRANYNMLQAWPLAVTAYNHGPNGMRRAVESVGSRDIAVILQRHESPSFKFASRNFYSCFVAVIQIMENVDRYFPNLQYRPRFEATTIRTPFAITPNTLIRTLEISERDFRNLNRSFRPVMFSQQRQIPANYAINLPVSMNAETALAALNAIPREQRAPAQAAVASRQATRGTPRAGGADVAGFDGYYTVVRGDNLYTIARNLGLTTAELAAANDITNARRIYVGQVLRIPGVEEVATATTTSGAATTNLTSDEPAVITSGTPGVAFTTVGGATSGEVTTDAETIDTSSASTITEPTPIVFVPNPPTRKFTSWRDPPAAIAIPLNDPRRIYGAGPIPDSVVAKVDETVVASAPTTSTTSTTTTATTATTTTTSTTAATTPPPTVAAATTAPTTQTVVPAAATAEAAVLPTAGRDGKPIIDTRFNAFAYDFAFTVAPDSATIRVTVSVDETVGHFAEWMRVDASAIRRANNMSANAGTRSGQRLTIPVPSRERIRRFETNRLQYHMAVEEDFFATYSITDFDRHVIRSGDNLWNICRDAEIPMWLLKKFNRHTNVDLNNLKIGDVLWIPRVVSKDGAGGVSVIEELGIDGE